MKAKILLVALLFFSLIVDSTLISFPIAVSICLLLYLLYPDAFTLVIVFIAGIFIDSLRLAPVGSTSLFLIVSCFAIYLYKNTFELKDIKLVVFLLFLFTFIYDLLFGYKTNIFIYLIIFALAEGLVYYFARQKSLGSSL